MTIQSAETSTPLGTRQGWDKGELRKVDAQACAPIIEFMNCLTNALPCMLLTVLTLASLTGCAAHPQRPQGTVTVLKAAPTASAERFVIERERYDKVLTKGPASFIQQVRVKPYIDRGRFRGFILLNSFPDSAPQEDSELQPGDVIQRINGQSVERPDQFMKVWNSLKGQKALTLRILRNNQPLKLTWKIR